MYIYEYQKVMQFQSVFKMLLIFFNGKFSNLITLKLMEVFRVMHSSFYFQHFLVLFSRKKYQQWIIPY